MAKTSHLYFRFIDDLFIIIIHKLIIKLKKWLLLNVTFKLDKEFLSDFKLVLNVIQLFYNLLVIKKPRTIFMSQALPILIKLYPKYSFGTTGSILPSAISSKAFPTGLEEWYWSKSAV